ncbi:hypothetical protein C7S14_4707 [Burkholderia cepacia]|nr:hypothetical protein C7S14_4707 [Burkholderia cepacia]
MKRPLQTGAAHAYRRPSVRVRAFTRGARTNALRPTVTAAAG